MRKKENILKKENKAAKQKARILEQKIVALAQMESDVGELYKKICNIMQEAHSHAARSVNFAMVRAYWLAGEAIVECEQNGKNRAEYGKQLIELLSQKLTHSMGNGFSCTNLKYMRQFYTTFPKSHALRDQLSWTHYRLLLKVEKTNARIFYEQEAAEQNWSTRELERQITTLFYERAILSKEKRKMLIQTRSKAEKYSPDDFVRDPCVLEFLGIKETSKLTESKLESLLLEHLQEFMLELGKGFCFIKRQQRITLDGDHFYIDLVFYNRLLCVL